MHPDENGYTETPNHRKMLWKTSEKRKKRQPTDNQRNTNTKI